MKLASERLAEGRPVEALRLADAALAAGPGNGAALETKLTTLQKLIEACQNTNERGWLNASASHVKAKLRRPD